jgi:hypothetical protein
MYNPLPWKLLTHDTRSGGYVADLDRRKIENAPSYTSSDAPDWSGPLIMGHVSMRIGW